MKACHFNRKGPGGGTYLDVVSSSERTKFQSPRKKEYRLTGMPIRALM
jgi:hypothetical protein